MFPACTCDDHRLTGNCEEGSGKCECGKEYQSPNCDSCSYGYFGYPHCRPCECFLNGTRGYHCEAVGGQCPCKPNYSGQLCLECSPGYYGFPECSGKIISPLVHNDMYLTTAKRLEGNALANPTVPATCV